MVFSSVAYAGREGSSIAKGSETFFTWGDPADIIAECNSTQQTMIYESIMQRVAHKDYINGLFLFGYWYVDALLTADDMLKRDKMAERILVGWFKYFPSSQLTQLESTEFPQGVFKMKSQYSIREIAIRDATIISHYSTKFKYM